MKSGVYRIIHIDSGKTYIGSSVDVRSRLNTHKRELVTNKHCNRLLQHAVNKYGINAFRFELLISAPPEDMLILEQEWINKTQRVDGKFGAGYNIMPVVGLDWTGCKHSEETKAKLSELNKGKKYSSEVTAKKMLALNTPQVKAKRLENCTKVNCNRKMSDDNKAKLIACSRQKAGIKLSDEHKAKISASVRAVLDTRPDLVDQLRLGSKRNHE